MPPQKQGIEKRAAILAYLGTYHREHGYPPSYREIADACGLSSTSHVAYHLDRLQAAGLVRREHNRPRTLRVVGVADALP